MPEPRPFVLIPGAWMGAWAWESVVPALHDRGHRAHALTLTGLAAGAPSADPADSGLETHVGEVLAFLEGADRRGVVLVGHSYSSLVAALVADRAPDRVARSVHIAGFLPQPGRPLLDAFPPE